MLIMMSEGFSGIVSWFQKHNVAIDVCGRYDEGLPRLVAPRFGKRTIIIFLTVLVYLSPTNTIQAQVGGPCAETIRKYCGDVTPGGGRVLKCLSDHRDNQSIACREWLEAQQQSLQQLNEACFEEIAQLCSFDPPDRIRIVRCLEENYVALKLDCRTKLREIKERLR